MYGCLICVRGRFEYYDYTNMCVCTDGGIWFVRNKLVYGCMDKCIIKESQLLMVCMSMHVCDTQGIVEAMYILIRLPYELFLACHCFDNVYNLLCKIR